MLQRLDVNLDCLDVDAQADFWCAALDYEPLGSAPPYRSITPRRGAGPKIVLQGVAEPPLGKIRMHFDLVVDDVDAEVARLESLGARRVDQEPVVEHGCRWVVMRDPEGNEFCVCDS